MCYSRPWFLSSYVIKACEKKMSSTLSNVYAPMEYDTLFDISHFSQQNNEATYCL